MKFRLTYDGRLESNGSAKHKHEIRKALHPQLKRLWDVEPNLLGWTWTPPPVNGVKSAPVPAWAGHSLNYSRGNYMFVPLVMPQVSLTAQLDILFLRAGLPGSIISSGDIDNRLKTLFDALRMPTGVSEFGGYNDPDENEAPFFVLLEDDKLISHVSVETDVLLQPTPTAKGEFLANDCRLVITVTLRPYKVTQDNLHFT